VYTCDDGNEKRLDLYDACWFIRGPDLVAVRFSF
jgi:hypothetical protein